MTKTAEFRHVLSFVQSHLDTQDVDLTDLEYTIDNHVRETTDDDGVRDIEVTGTSVSVSFEYTFDFEDD